MSDDEKQKKDAQWLLLVDRVMDTVDMVLSQFTSGRWLLTMAAGACLVHFAWSGTPEIQEKIISIIKDIIIFYFVLKNTVDSVAKNGGVNGQSSKSAD